jgi:hypothetical protein
LTPGFSEKEETCKEVSPDATEVAKIAGLGFDLTWILFLKFYLKIYLDFFLMELGHFVNVSFHQPPKKTKFT